MDTIAPTSDTRLFSKMHVLVATFLGAPLAGSILMALNYKRSGRPRHGITALVIGLVSTIGLFVIAYQLPDSFPNLLIPCLSLAAVHLWYQKAQQAEFEAHINAGGQKSSLAPPIGTGVLCLAGIVGVMLVPELLAPGMEFGRKQMFNGGELYCADDITDQQAAALGNYLVEIGFFDGHPKSAQIRKEGDCYQFRIAMQSGWRNNILYIEAGVQMARNISDNVFFGDPVETHYCNEMLETLNTVAAYPRREATYDPSVIIDAPSRQPGVGRPARGNTQSQYIIYVVRSKDTLSSIAKRHGSSVSIIQRLNGIPDADKISVGMRLRIPRNTEQRSRD